MDHGAQIEIQNIDITQEQREIFFPVKIITNIGTVECRYFHAFNPKAAVVLVGGVGGNWDTPAHDLYPRLSRELTSQSISSMWVKYRYPSEIEESVYDVLITIFFLKTVGIHQVGLVGHSLGGAVVIQAAALSPEVTTVATLSTQVFGAEAVSKLKNIPLLLIHGSEDKILPSYCSEMVHEMANDPKKLIIMNNTGHNLDESAPEVQKQTKNWLIEHLVP